MNGLPKQVNFRDSRLQNIAFTVITGFFFLGFALNVISGDEISGKGWIWGALFTVAFPIFLMNALNPGRMTLDRNGFQVKMFLNNTSARWDEIEDIKFYKQGGNHFFKIKKHGEKWKSKYSRIPMGFKAKPQEFIQILQIYRSAAISQNNQSRFQTTNHNTHQRPDRMAGVTRGGSLFGS